MQSLIHERFGEPEEVLHLADQPVPELQADQVRIRPLLAPIHHHDLWTVRGRYGYKPSFPAIGGSEAVGIIDAVGAEVEHLQVDQRVAVASVHGTWAKYFIAPSRMVIPLPDAIPDEVAAQLIAMPLSALMLLEFLQVNTDDWIIQNTANGTVDKTLAMLAQSRGVHSINLVRRDEAVAELQALGIQHVVSTIRAAVDSIGGQASADLLSLLGENGTLVSFGTQLGEPMQIASGDLIFKQATVKGFWGSKVSQNMSVANKKRLITELMQRLVSQELKLPVEAIFPFAEIKHAVKRSLSSGKQGKVLLIQHTSPLKVAFLQAKSTRYSIQSRMPT